jgi:hypothetical protein
MKRAEMEFIWRFTVETPDGEFKVMGDSGDYGNILSKLEDVGIRLSISTIYRLQSGYNREYVCNPPELTNAARKIVGHSKVFEWRIQIGKLEVKA